MGWLLDKAKQRVSRPSCTWIAKKMQQGDHPLVAGGPKQAGLANNIAKLDKGEGRAWWLKERHAKYRSALAAALNMPLEDLEAQLAEADGSPDPGRRFHFEVFPRLRALDLDNEPLYPGIPRELIEDDGPLGRTWWHSPQGAGRTLVGRWLQRRHGWRCEPITSAASPAFVEIETEPNPVEVRQRRIVAACPKPMPSSFREAGWHEVRTPSGWLGELIDWVTARLEPGGRFDADAARRWFQDESRQLIVTPGHALELMAVLDEGGVEALRHAGSGRSALARWAAAHAARQDRAVRPASRAFLRDHGATLLVDMETERVLSGRSASKSDLRSCVPQLRPPPSANAVIEALERDGNDGVRSLVVPTADDLVEAMIGLRWILEDGWGLPSRVHRHLTDAVVDKIVELPLATVAIAMGHEHMVAPLVVALAQPERLAAALDQVGSLDLDDASSVLALDALARSMALCVARGGVPSSQGMLLLSRALAKVSAQQPPWFKLPFQLKCYPGWSELSLLILHRGLGHLEGSEPESLWSLVGFVDSVLIEWHEDPADALTAEVRTLAVAVLADVIDDDVGSLTDPPAVAVLRDLVRAGRPPREDQLRSVGALGPVSLLAGLLSRWGGLWEVVAPVLWPYWCDHYDSIPWRAPRGPDDLLALSHLWSVVPADRLTPGHCDLVVAQAERGVAIPPSAWRRLVVVAYGGMRDALRPYVPLNLLEEFVSSPEDAVSKWASSALWTRAPESQESRLRALLGGEDHAQLRRVLGTTPMASRASVLSLVGAAVLSPATIAVVDRWLGTVMREPSADRPHAYRVWRQLRSRARPAGEPL